MKKVQILQVPWTGTGNEGREVKLGSNGSSF